MPARALLRTLIRPTQPGTGRSSAPPPIVIGLVNNMPDTALEATEAQFSRLLQAAVAADPVDLRFAYIPEVRRSSTAMERLAKTYWPIDELLRHELDALIVTGAEPLAPRLRDEPYWGRLGALLRWAQDNTASSIWSCLAAHAAVEHLDGIQRRRMEYKRCGVFEHEILPEHPLMRGINAPLSIPHSRWNELPVEALRAAGYTLASSSDETGADVFTRRTRSLLVFFQGHPEYEQATLLKEYRRDVGRFLRGEQPHYPAVPHGYFSARALATLDEFKARALRHREAGGSDAELLSSFPSAAATEGLRDTWGAAAVRIYSNWLAELTAARKVGAAPSASKRLNSRL